MNTTTALTLIDIHKSFGETRALKGVSIEVKEGEIVAILGPSGCGKSTLLQIVAGIEKPDQGSLLWKGNPLENTPPHLRGFGLMFQDYALFPHMNVFDNIAFGLRMSAMEKKDIDQQVEKTLNLVGLADFKIRNVNTLSGGEGQRVALARALVTQPRLLMLDEPLGSVDRTLRELLMSEIRQLLRHMHQTVLYVTHDQEEAFAIADRVVLMRAGEVEQIGTPQEIYSRPASLFVARFLGLTNLLPGEIRRTNGEYVIKTAIGDLPVSEQTTGLVTLLIRPDAVNLDSQGKCVILGKVIETTFRGSLCRTILALGEVSLTFDLPCRPSLPEIGQTLQLSFDPAESLLVFPREN